ncbi:MAG: extensin family protein [Alphaproteobacteria bacterium]|nr:MAG: extensin family protein [Alphaproteobacteria bacterium]
MHARLRTTRLTALAVVVVGLAATDAIASAPIPRAKPDLPSVALAVPNAAIIPRRKPGKPSSAEVPARGWPKSTGAWPKSEVLAARAACERMLSGLDIIWRPDQPIGEPGGCGTPAPIAIAEVAQIRIDPPATVNCAFAQALHGWFSQSVQLLARSRVGASVAGIRNASSYACRRRNNASSGKLSEHARANALDIAAFAFSKKTQITVAGGGTGLLQKTGLSANGNFTTAVRKSACGYFNTVLGPGADRYHGDHFHVDLMKLRPGRFKMCR